MLDKWVEAAAKKVRWSQAEMARQLTQRLGRSVDKAAVNKLIKGTRELAADEMLAIADLTGYPLPGIALVPLVKWISAGQFIEPQSIDSTETIEMLRIPGLSDGRHFALRVSGDSMDRESPDGSVIVVDTEDRELFDGKSYIFSTRDGATYKVWRSRPPRLEPASTNPTHQSLFLDPEDDPRVVGRVVKTLKDL